MKSHHGTTKIDVGVMEKQRLGSDIESWPPLLMMATGGRMRVQQKNLHSSQLGGCSCYDLLPI